MTNQCDGCRRKLPLVHGVHYGEGYDMIGCTKERYEFEFGPDAYRDNEEERLHTYAYAERLNGGDSVEDLEREELEQIITLAKHEGASPAMVDFAKRANDHLDNEDEREGTLAMERAFTDYWGDTGSHSEEAYRQDMNDAGRGHLLP